MEIYMEDHLINKYRYERKYIISHNYLQQFLASLYLKNFIQKFKLRKINNVYFDDYDFTSLNENIDGLSRRKKHRIRWYGPTFDISDKKIEIKIKNEFLNTKQNFSVPLQKLESLGDILLFYNKIRTYVLESNNFNLFQLMSSKRPTLYNKYERMYFEDIVNNVRITIDSSLEYFSPITKMKYKEKFIIIEAKYNNDEKFKNNFKHLSLTRYSKYVKGTLQTSCHNHSY
jgi:hypothetical protein